MIPYDSEIALQGEDLEKLAHVHRELCTRLGLTALFECLKSRNILPGADQLRFILIMKFNVEADGNQPHPHVSTQVSIKTFVW